jgi:hypothetical protein
LLENFQSRLTAHNHPSGISDPSQADRVITAKLKEALALIDVRVLDHFIVGETVFSFAEHGLLRKGISAETIHRYPRQPYVSTKLSNGFAIGNHAAALMRLR